MSPSLYPIPSHSCDLLEDLLPSLSQYGSASALSDDEDLEFLMIVPQDSLSLLVNFFALVVDYHLLVDNLLNPIHVQLQNIYSHGLDCTGSFGFFTKTLGSYL